MAKVVMNIGLGSAPGLYMGKVIEDAMVARRRAIALEWVATMGVDFYVEFRDLGVPEPTLVVVWPVARGSYLTKAGIDRLCDSLGQWAVAVEVTSNWMHSGLPIGRVVGPRAEDWGPFDSDQFIRPLRNIE